MPKITKRFVDSAHAEPDRAQTLLWDSRLKGFGLRVSASGKKSYIFQYRNAHGRSRRLTVGDASRITAMDARRLARIHAGDVERGLDPVEERNQARQALTLRELAERYMSEHAIPKKKPSSIKTDERLLRLCLLPCLGHLKVAEITRADARRMHHASRKTPVQANRALLLLSKMMNLAESWGLRKDRSNPTRGVERFPEKPRERFLSPEEFARLGAVLDEVDEKEEEHPSAILALRLLILTGARSGEILSLRWDEVDLDRRCLRLKDSKTGGKIIPLASAAVDLLRKAPRVHGNPYVCFGARRGQHFVGLPKVWYRIRARAGLNDVRTHDLRHSFAAVGAGGGISLPIIGGLLGHSQPQTTARYAHLASDPLHEAADRIGSEIAFHLESGTGDEQQEVDDGG